MQTKNVDSDTSLLIDTNRKGLLEKSSLSLLDKVIWNLRFVNLRYIIQKIALCLITGKIFFMNAFFELKFSFHFSCDLLNYMNDSIFHSNTFESRVFYN